MKKDLSIFIVIACLYGCLPKIQWDNNYNHEEYAPYLKDGSASISGQAFSKTMSGEVRYAAGNTITLDPVTNLGSEWWEKEGRFWTYTRYPSWATPIIPFDLNYRERNPNEGFLKARRVVLADGEGNFYFKNIPAGDYYIRTDIIWFYGQGYTATGVAVGLKITVRDGEKITHLVLPNL